MIIFLLSLILSVSAEAALPCGSHPLEQQYPSLVWKKFTDIQVRSSVANIDSIICVGKVANSEVAERVTYRDEGLGTQVARSVEELENFQVLISSTDLPADVRGMVRSGGLVSLRINNPTTDPESRTTKYSVSVRFHRNLGRSSTKDVRQMDFTANLNFERDVPRPERNGEFFNIIRLYLSLFPMIRMEQMVLKENATTVDNFFTSALPKVGDLLI